MNEGLREMTQLETERRRINNGETTRSEIFVKAKENLERRAFAEKVFRAAVRPRQEGDKKPSTPEEIATARKNHALKITDVLSEDSAITPATRIAELIFNQREELKRALHIELAPPQKTAETAEEVPQKEQTPQKNDVDTQRAIRTVLEKIVLPEGYRQSPEGQILTHMTHENEVLTAIAKILNVPGLNIDMNDQEMPDRVIDATIAYFYGGKKELLETLYPGEHFTEPNRPPITEAFIRSAIPEDPIIREQLCTRLIQARIHAKTLMTVVEMDFDDLAEFLFDEEAETNETGKMKDGTQSKSYKNELARYEKARNILGREVWINIILGILTIITNVLTPNKIIMGVEIAAMLVVAYLNAYKIYKDYKKKREEKIYIRKGYKRVKIDEKYDDYLFYLNEIRYLWAKVWEGRKLGNIDQQSIELAEEQILLYHARAKTIMGLNELPKKFADLKIFLPKMPPERSEDLDNFEEWHKAEEDAQATEEAAKKSQK